MIGFAAGIQAALDYGVTRLQGLLKEMTPEQLEATPAGYNNSIATLVIHTYGLEARLSYGFRGQQVPEDLAQELLLNLPRTQTLPVVKGETAESLLAKVEKSHSLFKEALATLTEADLDRELPMGPNRTVSIGYLLSLLPHHQGQHYGHMQMIKAALA